MSGRSAPQGTALDGPGKRPLIISSRAAPDAPSLPFARSSRVAEMPGSTGSSTTYGASASRRASAYSSDSGGHHPNGPVFPQAGRYVASRHLPSNAVRQRVAALVRTGLKNP